MCKQLLTVFSLRYLDYPKMLSKRLNLKLAASWSKFIPSVCFSFHQKDRRRYTRLQHVIFELEASELVGSINRPRAWTAFRAYGFELTEVLSNLTDWKEMRLPSYVAQGSPSWLQGLLAEEGTGNSV
ncbi:BnaC01g30680D [Brassica napus]|uniref:BnaC01g30680D protein n=1 Tax=Brassica napus TaxID=3708 RepID=A0A078FB37_BRANA|nr:BnaC01g30680D [Brassica napus]